MPGIDIYYDTGHLKWVRKQNVHRCAKGRQIEATQAK